MNGDLPGIFWQAVEGLHIDVRGLEPPEPMVAILGHLEAANQAGPVTVHHDREPVYLYPELAERGWDYRLVKGAPGEVRLILSKASRP
jgi:uncharacterized protein (DUF2249 family)